jgi:hypothetical protein
VSNQPLLAVELAVIQAFPIIANFVIPTFKHVHVDLKLVMAAPPLEVLETLQAILEALTESQFEALLGWHDVKPKLVDLDDTHLGDVAGGLLSFEVEFGLLCIFVHLLLLWLLELEMDSRVEAVFGAFLAELSLKPEDLFPYKVRFGDIWPFTAQELSSQSKEGRIL